MPTTIYADNLIFISSGYRQPQPVYAVRPGARGDISLADGETSNEFVAWSTATGGPYMPTPIVYRGYLYTCANSGVLTCYEAATGKTAYRQRLPGRGAFTASPVAADGKVFFASEEGGVPVVMAGPQFALVADNALGESCLATPAISDGMIFFRTESHVVAIGRTSEAQQLKYGSPTNK